MKHSLRATPMVAGLLYLTLAVVFMLEATDQADVDLRWIPAIVLIGLGIAVTLGGLTRRRPSPAEGDVGGDASTTSLS